MRTGHESITQSQPCWALPRQAEGSNTEIRSSAHEQDGANLSTLTGRKKGYKSGNTNEDTATVAKKIFQKIKKYTKDLKIIQKFQKFQKVRFPIKK